MSKKVGYNGLIVKSILSITIKLMCPDDLQRKQFQQAALTFFSLNFLHLMKLIAINHGRFLFIVWFN